MMAMRCMTTVVSAAGIDFIQLRHFWCYSNNYSTVHHTERKFELKVNDVVMTSQAYTQFTIIGNRTVNDVMQPACAAAHAQTDVLKRRDQAIDRLPQQTERKVWAARD